MEDLVHRATEMSDEEMILFETKLAKCMECQNWFDVSKLEPLREYACDECGGGIVRPMKISEFWLYDIIGEGGMGCVYTARQFGDPTIYAVKMSDYTDESDFCFKSLLYEGQMLTKLKYRHIVNSHRFGFKEGKAFLLMDYEAGLTLAQLTRRERAPELDLIEWMYQLTKTLKFIYEKGYIYRDLKPQNIIIHEGQIKLLDFGMCSPVDQSREDKSDTLLGSLAYMPPSVFWAARKIGARICTRWACYFSLRRMDMSIFVVKRKTFVRVT